MRSLLYCLVTIALTLAATPILAQHYQYDSAGRLTAATYPGGGSINYEYDANSNITRIRYASGAVTGLPPEGTIDTPAGNLTIQAGKSVSFTGTGTDPDGATPLTYFWDFGGGAMSSTQEDPGSVRFANAGTYTVRFTVTDATNLDDPTPDMVVVTVQASKRGGGGSMSLLMLLLCTALWLARRRRTMVVMAMMLAGVAQAQTWSQMNSPTSVTLNDVWAAAADDAWAVGDGGTLLHFDGASWSPVDLGITARLTAIWGVSDSDIMIVGDGGLVLQYNGATWQAVDIGAGTMNLTDVWYTGNGKRYIVGVRGAWFDLGSGWERQFFDSFYDGRTQTPTYTLTAVRASANHVVITTNTRLAGRGGFFVDLDQVDVASGNGLWVFDDTHMFFSGPSVDGGAVRRLNGGDPTQSGSWIPELGGGGGGNDIWATAWNNMYVAAESSTYGIIWHYDGSGWTQQVAVNSRKFYGIHGPDESTAFAVGALGTIYRLAGPARQKTAANYPFSGVTEGNVNTFTGELVHETTDFAIGSDPVEFRRYYASNLWTQGTVGGSLGENWTHNYEWRLDTAYQGSANRIRITDYRGTEYVFDVGATSIALISPTWANVTLSVINGTYVLADHDADRLYGLGPQGLAWMEDRNGNRITPLYTQGTLVSVTNNKDTILRFEYAANGRISRVFVPEVGEELEVAFTYDAGLLTGATASGNVQTGYTYEGGAFLTAVEVAGVVEKEWDYGAQNRVIATTLTHGGPFIYSYNGSTFSITEPGATIRAYVHDDEGRLRSLTNGVGATRSWGYDAQGRRISLTDPLGRTTAWSYDPAHRKIASITEPGNQVTQYQYAGGSSLRGVAFWDLVAVTRADGGVQQFGYDDRGNVLTRVDETGRQSAFTYNGIGRLLTVVNAAGGTTTYTYSLDGDVLSRMDPAGNTTLYRYDQFKRLNWIRYADMAVATLEYSTRFVPDHVTLRSGAVMTYTYDAGNRLVRIERSDGYFEQYGYDSSGLIVSETLPGNRTTEYRYDARGNVERVLAPDLTFELFQFDAADRLVRYTDAESRMWDFEYAADDALTAVVKPDSQRIQYGYLADPRGLLSTVLNGTEMSSFAYDAVGRLSGATDRLQRTNLITRNTRGDVEQVVTMPANLVHAYDHDALGNVIRYTTPGGGAFERVFGDDGLLDSHTDPLGNETSYQRDGLNRVEAIDHPDGTAVAIDYAVSGVPGLIVADDGTQVEIDSTPEGHVLGGTNLATPRTVTGKVSNSNGIAITYDIRDRVKTMALAAGKNVEFEYNNRGKAVLVRDWLGGETRIGYTGSGKVASIALPNTTTTMYDYDLAGRVSKIDYGAAGSITLIRNADGRVEQADRALPGPARLPDEDRRFVYNSGSQKVSASYDLRGNQLGEGQRSWSWDGLNRLSANSGMPLQYDALGSLVGIGGANPREFVINYALDTPRVSIELDGSGNARWFSVHTPDGRLLYRVSPAGARQYYHFDERGNTRFMTNDAGQVIQTYAIAPHNEVFDASGSVDNDYIISAQYGALDIGARVTWYPGGQHIDEYSGHRLSASQLELHRLIFGSDPQPIDWGRTGRSVAPGEREDAVYRGLIGRTRKPTADEIHQMLRPELRYSSADRPTKSDTEAMYGRERVQEWRREFARGDRTEEPVKSLAKMPGGIGTFISASNALAFWSVMAAWENRQLADLVPAGEPVDPDIPEWEFMRRPLPIPDPDPVPAQELPKSILRDVAPSRVMN